MTYGLFHCVECVWCSLYYHLSHIFCNHIPMRAECVACKTHDITSLGTRIVLGDNVHRSLWYLVSCVLTVGSHGSVTIVGEGYVIMKLPCWSALLAWKGRPGRIKLFDPEVVTPCSMVEMQRFEGIKCLHPPCRVNQVRWTSPRPAKHKRWFYSIDRCHYATNRKVEVSIPDEVNF
jgi:hypothetical protein